MLIDFLAASIRRRAQHGQPIAEEAVNLYYTRTARALEALDPDVQAECIHAPKASVDLLADKPRIFFHRPKSDLHVAAIKGEFQAIRTDSDLRSGAYVEGDTLWIPDIYWRYLMGKALESEGQASQAWLQYLIDQIEAAFRAWRPKLIVLITDVQHLERLMAVVAKSLGIPTVVIQHGLFSGKFPPLILEGDACDHFVAWSEFTKRLLLKSGYLNPEQISICGYPYPLHRPSPVASSNAKTVVFLGQPYESYRSDQTEAKWEIATSIMLACSKLGLKFAYRPHPAEDPLVVAKVIPTDKILSAKESLPDLFKNSAAFFSLTSTALVEAALHGRVAIQVYDEVFDFDDYQEVGACYSCRRAGIEEILTRFSKGDLPPKEVSADYLPVLPNFSETLAALYKQAISHPKAQPVATRETVTVSQSESTEPSMEWNPAPRIIDSLRWLETVPSFLDVEEFGRDVRERWSPPLIASKYASFAMPRIREAYEVKSFQANVKPPEEGAGLTYLQELDGALSQPGLRATWLPGNSFSREPITMRAQFIHRLLGDELDRDGELLPEKLTELQSLVRASQEASMAEAMLSPLNRAKAQALALGEPLYPHFKEVSKYRDRLTQLRESKHWKFATKLLKVVGRTI